MNSTPAATICVWAVSKSPTRRKNPTRLATWRPTTELRRSVGLGEQKSSDGAWRAYYDPSFGSIVVGQRRRVVHEVEAKDVLKEVDRVVVVVDDDRRQLYVHFDSVEFDVEVPQCDHRLLVDPGDLSGAAGEAARNGDGGGCSLGGGG